LCADPIFLLNASDISAIRVDSAFVFFLTRLLSPSPG
jgi:hypothetical protein